MSVISLLRRICTKIKYSDGMVCVHFRKVMSWCEWLWRMVFFLFWRLKSRLLALIYTGSDRDGESSDRSTNSASAENEEAPPRSLKDKGAAGRNPWQEEEESEEEDFYCEYDSTWDSDDEDEVKVHTAPRPTRSNYKFDRFRNAARDMRNYRKDYPGKPPPWNQHEANKPNLDFYLGRRMSSPDDVSIYEFHNMWYGDYDRLERTHTFIQWLFPLQEPGVNRHATELTKAEIKEFLEDTTAKNNLLASYKLMLDFYGIALVNEGTGEVRRAENWTDRFHNMNTHTHNNLRITRILKCLGTLGFSHYQAPLVRFFLQETLVKHELPNVKDSVLNYFMFAVLDKNERKKLVEFAYLNYNRREEFVWCPKKVQMLLSLSGKVAEEKSLD